MTAHADYHEVMFSDKISPVHVIFGYATNGIAEYRDDTTNEFAITEKLIRNAVIVMEM